MEYNDMLSGPATKINSAALDREFVERRGATSANKLLRQVTQNQFSRWCDDKVQLYESEGFKVRSPT
jgi:hypothetical protein